MVLPDKEIWEFGTPDSVLFSLEDVRRGRDLDIDAIVWIESPSQLEGLRRFNAEESLASFLLIYGGNVMAHYSQADCPLKTEHVFNAGAMALEPKEKTAYPWEEHLRGLAETLGMMIGRGEVADTGLFRGEVISHFTVEQGLSVYRRPMRIRYSSSRQIAIVTPRE